MLEYFAKFIFNLNYELTLHLHYIYKNYLFYLLQQIYSVVLRKLLPRFALRGFLDPKISNFFTRVTFYTATGDALVKNYGGRPAGRAGGGLPRTPRPVGLFY